MSKTYFVGGASGSGKTFVIPELKKLLGNDITLYDFDDIGVPENADKAWRQKSTEIWLQNSLKKMKMHACLVRLSWAKYLHVHQRQRWMK